MEDQGGTWTVFHHEELWVASDYYMLLCYREDPYSQDSQVFFGSSHNSLKGSPEDYTQEHACIL